MKKKINYKRLAKMYKNYKKRIYAKRETTSLFNKKEYTIYYTRKGKYLLDKIFPEHIEFYPQLSAVAIRSEMRRCLRYLIHQDRINKLSKQKYYLSNLI